MRNTGKLATAGAVALVLTTTACAGSAVREGSGGGGNTIRVSTGASLITDLPDYVADANGFYKKQGVKIERISTQHSSEASQLVISGGADTARGLVPTVQAWAKSGHSVDLVSVADLIIRPPYVMVGSPDVKRWKQLTGKKIGIASPTDNGTIISRDAFKAKGVGRTDLITAGGTSERFSALKKKAIDATLMFPPVNFKAVNDEGMTDLGYLPKVLGSDWEFTFNSVIVSKKWAEQHSDVLVKYLKALDESLRWLSDPANRQKTIEILAKATKSTTKEAAKTYDLTVAGKPAVFASRIGVRRPASARVINDLIRFGYLKKQPDLNVDQFLDDGYAKRARGEG